MNNTILRVGDTVAYLPFDDEDPRFRQVVSIHKVASADEFTEVPWDMKNDGLVVRLEGDMWRYLSQVFPAPKTVRKAERKSRKTTREKRLERKGQERLFQ